jgi:hypothetical protein
VVVPCILTSSLATPTIMIPKAPTKKTIKTAGMR